MSVVKAILIGGTGRSGTNLLKGIFAKHSQIASLPFEHRFTIDPEGIVDFYNTYPTLWSPFWADARIKRLEAFLLSLAEVSSDKLERTNRSKQTDSTGLKLSPPPYSGWELEKWIPGYKKLVNKLISDLVTFKYSAIWPGSIEGSVNNEMYFAPRHSKDELTSIMNDFISGCHESICKRSDKSIFVEDNTHNILFAQDVLKITPNSKLIHVVRDPKDVVASLSAQRWAPLKTNETITWYENVMTCWEAQKSQLSHSTYLEIKLEDLIRDTQNQLINVCQFIGIEFEASMLEIELDKSKIGAWKQHPDATIIENDQSLNLAAARYGYQ